MLKNKNLIFNLLKFSAFFVFVSRAFQYVTKGAPYRAMLWDEKRMAWFYDWIGIGYETFVTDIKYDNMLGTITKFNALFYVVAAIALLMVKLGSNVKWQRVLVQIGGISLVVLTFLQAKDKFESIAMFFEHSIQFGLPFITIYYARTQNLKVLITVLTLLVALTFTCHGIYATGEYYRLPGNFISMTQRILGLSDDNTLLFLYIAGVVDIILAIAIFYYKIAKPFLVWAFIWGTLTAFARIVYGLSFGNELYLWKMYGYETTVRFAHGLVPLALLLAHFQYSGFLFKKVEVAQ